MGHEGKNQSIVPFNVKITQSTRLKCQSIARFITFYSQYAYMYVSGETEEEFSTRLADNLEKLILKEGPETVV